MALYTKDLLTRKSVEELQAIADSMGTAKKDSQNKEELIYDILDAQAERSAEQDSAPVTKRRSRIVKKDVDHIYSSTENPRLCIRGTGEKKKDAHVGKSCRSGRGSHASSYIGKRVRRKQACRSRWSH